MDSSSSDEEELEVPSAKDKGEEELQFTKHECLSVTQVCQGYYLLTHFPWSDLAAKGTLDQTQTNKLLNECENLNSDYKAKVMDTPFFQVFFFF